MLNHRISLKEWLFIHRITVKDFAQTLGITRIYLHQIIKGQFIPSDDLMERIKQNTEGWISTYDDLLDKR
jgi:transcriptional regulator with XRE-family HTH domain